MTTDPKLTHASMKDWQNLATRGGQRLPASFIKDAHAIIFNMLTKGTASKLLAIADMLRQHTEVDVDPHQFDIYVLKDPIIEELFKVYRNQCLPGDRKEMLTRLFQIIPITDYSEAYRGEEDTKAVNTVKAQLQIQPHEQDLHCHYGMLTQFMPKTIMRTMPTVTLHDQFITAEYYKEFFIPTGFQYPISTNNWNENSGTLVLAFEYMQYDWMQRFLECYDKNGDLKVSMRLDKDDTFRVYRHGYEKPNELLFEQKVDPVEHGHRKIVLSYNLDKIIIRATIGPMKVHTFGMQLNVTSVLFRQPFIATKNKSRVESFVYYPSFTDEETTLVSLID